MRGGPAAQRGASTGDGSRPPQREWCVSERVRPVWCIAILKCWALFVEFGIWEKSFIIFMNSFNFDLWKEFVISAVVPLAAVYSEAA